MESIQKLVDEREKIYRQIDLIYHQAAVSVGLSDAALDVLWALATAEGQMTQKQVCDNAYVGKQTVNSAVAKLESQGLVARTPGAGRSVIISLTPAGQEFVDAKVMPFVHAENDTFRQMDPEDLATFMRLEHAFTNQLAANIGAACLKVKIGL